MSEYFLYLYSDDREGGYETARRVMGIKGLKEVAASMVVGEERYFNSKGVELDSSLIHTYSFTIHLDKTNVIGWNSIRHMPDVLRVYEYELDKPRNVFKGKSYAI